MNLLRRWPAAMLAAAALYLSVAGPVAADNTSFPRRAIIEYGGPFDKDGERYRDQGFRDSIARFDLTILTTWPGFGTGTPRYTIADTVADLKSTATANQHNIKIFLYAKEDNVDASTSAWATFRDPIAQNHWYLYPSGTSGTPVTSPFGANYPTINTTVPAAVDYMTDFFDQYLAVDGMDGWFMDDMFAKTRTSGDWNRDGNGSSPVDTAGTPESSTRLRQGWSYYVSRMRADSPAGMPQLGNVADWGINGVVDSEYQGLLDGGMMEGMIGTGYAQENISWLKMMDQYHANMAAFTGEKIGIFVQDGDPADPKLFRYGLTSALMDNAYYAFSEPGETHRQYHSIHWFDEYDVNLGQATSPPQTAAWQAGVYRRDFENGIALVNPKGNGGNNGTDPVTVTLEAPYVKILAGSASDVHHDPVVNNGATVTSVTFQGRDGIILLRTSTPGKFGRTTIGTVPSAGMGTNQKRGSKFTLSEAGTVTNFSAYLDGLGGTSGAEQVRVVLYQDASGVPGALVTDSNIVTINSGAAGAWINFTPTSSVTLAAGSYWLVLHTGGTAGVARNMGDGTSTQNWYSNADTFSDGASNPFGSGSVGTGTISIYASYTAGVPKTFGNTTAGTVPSSGMSADFKRASKYTLNETGTLVSLAAYLDGNGGTAGSQGVRLALYQDASGVPGNKVAETNTVNIAAGTAPGWVTFTATTQAALTAGSYWIAVHTGGTAGVARDYTDGSSAQNWFANADTFSDGSASPFGSGNLGAQNLAVYVNYLH